MSYRARQKQRGPGLYESLSRRFRKHPIAMPLAFILFGMVITVPPLALHHSFGVRLLGFGFIALAIGVVLFPIGIVTVLRRRSNIVVLRCPQCGRTSDDDQNQFRVERMDYLDYAYVSCTTCGADFTVDKYARLT
jgi:predicted RNA-binding Zn-ribbon protein involved in translation (DUF1610 family)